MKSYNPKSLGKSLTKPSQMLEMSSPKMQEHLLQSNKRVRTKVSDFQDQYEKLGAQARELVKQRKPSKAL